jgi:DNA-directed RNA polymerase specialized sigma24 family protein
MSYIPPKNEQEAIQECKLVISKLVTKWTRNHYQNRDDIYQQACVGVLEAFQKYNPDQYKQKFSTYAWYYVLWRTREYAMGTWDRMNNDKSFELYGDEGEYSINTDMIDTERKYDKACPITQQIVSLKTEGYTFREISDILELGGLHKARNQYLEWVEG